jgi:hypothetical protein
MKTINTTIIKVVVFCFVMMATSAAWAGGTSYTVRIINDCNQDITFIVTGFLGVWGGAADSQTSSCIAHATQSITLKAGYSFGTINTQTAFGVPHPRSAGNQLISGNVNVKIVDGGGPPMDHKCNIDDITTY